MKRDIEYIFVSNEPGSMSKVECELGIEEILAEDCSVEISEGKSLFVRVLQRNEGQSTNERIDERSSEETQRS